MWVGAGKAALMAGRMRETLGWVAWARPACGEQEKAVPSGEGADSEFRSRAKGGRAGLGEA